MSEKYASSGWVWILAAAIVVGFVALGFYLIQTQQRLKAVEVELGGAREETGRANAGAAELAKVVENLRLELKAANAALNEYQGKLDKANAAIAELSKKLDTVQADLGKRRSQLQDMEDLALSVFTSLATRSNILRSPGLRPVYLPQLVLDPLMITSQLTMPTTHATT